jgi:nucleoside-diphosphate-sugar epimerase
MPAGQFGSMPTVLVFGASGAIGRYLLPLLGAHYKVLPVSRVAREGWICGDLNPLARYPAADIVISLGPLDAFAAWLARQTTLPRRLIAVSSMSAQSKRDSPDPAERELAERLRAAEAKLLEIGRASDIDCTIFRPTLIYGAGIDRSLAPIARFVRRWRVLPIPLGARGLRQPVHAQDIARACNAVIDNPATYGKTYALGGGERLTFSAMLRRLRGKQAALLIPLPRFLLRALRTGGGFSSGALSRLNEALIADNEPAMREFGYAPRAFVAEAVLPGAAPEKQ